MKRSIVITKDGSKTIRLEDWNEHYHSTHGAIQEAMHVYIKAGLDHYLKNDETDALSVLEAGFGTGLNALLAFKWSQEHQIAIDYTGVEAYPVSDKEWKTLDYHLEIDGSELKTIFEKLHNTPWEQWVALTADFRLRKKQQVFSDVDLKSEVDVVFYDAFGPRVQPELWEAFIFQKFYDALKPGGIFVTYSVKGTAKRALQGLGFVVDIIEGPPGKRHMMRAVKPL